MTLSGKTLVFAPSRAGKTYFSNALKSLGINAIDAEKDTNLLKWRSDATGETVEKPDFASESWLSNNHFTIKPEELSKFLAKQKDIIFFAHSWNIIDEDIMSQFDRAVYMSLPDHELERRLTIRREDHKADGNPVTIDFFRKRHAKRAAEAKLKGIKSIDAMLSPERFYEELCKLG